MAGGIALWGGVPHHTSHHSVAALFTLPEEQSTTRDSPLLSCTKCTRTTAMSFSLQPLSLFIGQTHEPRQLSVCIPLRRIDAPIVYTNRPSHFATWSPASYPGRLYTNPFSAPFTSRRDPAADRRLPAVCRTPKCSARYLHTEPPCHRRALAKRLPGRSMEATRRHKS